MTPTQIRIHRKTVDQRMDVLAFQTVFYGTLEPTGRQMWLARWWDRREEAENEVPPSVVSYRFPYAKDARHQIRWKKAYAPVVTG